VVHWNPLFVALHMRDPVSLLDAPDVEPESGAGNGLFNVKVYCAFDDLTRYLSDVLQVDVDVTCGECSL